jgi:hypothetical protein
MFSCVCSRFVWVSIKEAFGWERFPISLEDFICNWLDGKMYKDNNMLVLFGLGAVCWALWKTRTTAGDGGLRY